MSDMKHIDVGPIPKMCKCLGDNKCCTCGKKASITAKEHNHCWECFYSGK